MNAQSFHVIRHFTPDEVTEILGREVLRERKLDLNQEVFVLTVVFVREGLSAGTRVEVSSHDLRGAFQSWQKQKL